MIHWLNVKNYRSLRDVRIDFLQPFSVIIGANNTGKTSILRILKLLCRLASESLTSIFQEANAIGFVKYQGTTEPLEFALKIDYFADGEIRQFIYHIAITSSLPGGWLKILEEKLESEDSKGKTQKLLFKNRNQTEWKILNERSGIEEQFNGDPSIQGIFQLRDRDAHKSILKFCETLKSSWTFDLQPEMMRDASPIVPNAILMPDGSNLPTVVDNLKSEYSDTFDLLIKDLRRIIPEIDALLLKTIEGGRKFIAFKEKYLPSDVYAFQTSDGILRLVAMLAFIHAPRGPSLLAVEEPENGFHPRRLEQIVELLREYTRQRNNEAPRQVIITTHSPYLLDWVKPEEILIATRDNAGTQLKSISDIENVRRLLEDAPLGEVWHRGSIGGVPMP